MSSPGWPCRRVSFHRRRPLSSRHFRRRLRSRHRLAPSTPLLSWKSDLPLRRHNAAAKPDADTVALSTRAIAAGLWELCFDEFSGAKPCRQTTPQRDESLPKQRASERKPEPSKESDGDVFYVVGHRKKHVSKRLAGASVAAELAKARSRVRELEAKKHSLRKKVAILLSKLEDERLPHRRRQDRNREAADELCEKLIAERRLRRRLEKVNAKLTEQLAEVNRASEKTAKDYSEEKKSRETLESLCGKLVQRISEDHSIAERTKTEYEKAGEELAEERRMLQLAEGWREERVQMKLVDAKLALEERFSAMSTLTTELNSLLRHASCSLDVGDLQRAERILHSAARALSSQDIGDERSHDPAKSNDVISVLQEVNEAHLQASNRFTDYDSALEEDVAHDQSSPERAKVKAGPPGPRCSPASPETSIVKHNVSPISRIRRSKVLGEAYRIVSDEGDGVKGVVPRRRACLENPHVARGMRGCIEWPRVMPKNGKKAKISEAIIESQKCQLRNILKPKT